MPNACDGVRAGNRLHMKLNGSRTRRYRIQMLGYIKHARTNSVLVLFSTGDTFRKASLEECQRVGDGPKRDPSEDHIQTRSNTEE